jgi:hypothetical protein
MLTAAGGRDQGGDLSRILVRLRRMTDRTAGEQPHRTRRTCRDPLRGGTRIIQPPPHVDRAAEHHGVAVW